MDCHGNDVEDVYFWKPPSITMAFIDNLFFRIGSEKKLEGDNPHESLHNHSQRLTCQ